MDIGEKVAYLKGLAEGLEISSDSKNGRNGKILKGILDVLEDIADSIQNLEEENELLENYIEEIDEDLGEIEENFEKTCGSKLLKSAKEKHKHINLDIDDEFEIYDEENFENEGEESGILDGVIEIKCPHCKKRVLVETDEIFESESLSVNCPECGDEIEILEDYENCNCAMCAKKHEESEDDESVDSDDDVDDEDENDDDEDLAF